MAKNKAITKNSANNTAPKKPTVKISAKTDLQMLFKPVDKFKSLKIRKAYIILILIMFSLGVFLYYARGLFVAAVVNGQPVSRLAIVKEAEKQSGRQAFEDIVRNTLIEQEARKQNVTVSEQEIDAEIKIAQETIAKQGQKLDDVLTMRGMTKNDFRKLVRLDKLVGKIVGKDVKVTNKEIDEYIEKNKEALPQDQSAEQLRKMVEDQLRQQKRNEKVHTWLELLRNKAKILYFVQY